MKRLIPLIVTAVFLNGCTLIPKYTRPRPPVPETFPKGEAYPDARLSGEWEVDDLRWREIFPDQKLQRVIELSLANNRDLRLAVLNVQRAQSLYGVQRAELFPSVNAAQTFSKQRVPADLSATGTPVEVEQNSVNLGITSWEIDLFGRIRSLSKQALEQYLGTEQAMRGSRTALIAETARAYLALASDQERLKLAEATLETQRGIYGVIWQQYDKGLAAETDLRRSQTQVDTARAEIARYTQQVAQDRNALDLLAGATVPEELLPTGMESVAPLGQIKPGLSSAVLLRRPDIIAAEHQLKAANAFIGAARAAFFPRISLTTLFGSASNDLAGLFGPGSGSWSFVPQAALPVFDARTYAAYKVSKANRDIYLAEYERTIQNAFREVADTLAVAGMVDEQVSAQESIVDSAKKIYELSYQRYSQGVDGYLNVLDAQRSLYTAQQQLTSLRLARLSNQVTFYSVLGGDGGNDGRD